MSQMPGTGIEGEPTGFFQNFLDFLRPVATAARDNYMREEFPELFPAVDTTTQTQTGITPAELAEQSADAERRLYLIGGAAVLTVALVALIAARS